MKSVKKPSRKQVVVEYTHEAIVDRETWDIAPRICSQHRRPTRMDEMDMFSGIVFCGDCGAKLTLLDSWMFRRSMHREREKHGHDTKIMPLQGKSKNFLMRDALKGRQYILPPLFVRQGWCGHSPGLSITFILHSDIHLLFLSSLLFRKPPAVIQ